MKLSSPKPARGTATWRILLTFLTTLLLCLILTPVLVAGAEDLQDQLDDVNKQLEQNQQDIEEAKKQESDLTQQIRELDEKMVGVSKDLNSLETSLSSAQSERKRLDQDILGLTKDLQQKEKEIGSTEAKLKRKTSLYEKRLVKVYKEGDSSYYELLLQAQDLKTLLDRLNFLGRIVKSDAQLVEGIKKDKSQLEEQRKEIVKNKETIEVKRASKYAEEKEIERLTLEQRGKRNELARSTESKETLLGQVKDDKEEFLRQQEELEQSSQAIAAKLRAQQSTRPRASGGLIWPTSGSVTSDYGMRVHPIYGTSKMHNGVDIGAPYGQDIYAAQSGVVVTAAWMSGYGQTVVIDHGGGLSTLYAHTSVMRVSEGQSVSQGQVIADVGCTGSCTGPHLHYEVRENGNPQNPMNYY